MLKFILKKYLIFVTYFVLFNQNIFSYPTEEFITALSNPIVWAQKKNKFHQYLKKGIIKSNYLNLEGLNLKYIDFSGMRLEGVNLKNSNLKGANFKMTSLCYSNLSGANLTSTNFHLADLYSANLIDANLFDADLSYANLNLVKLSNGFNVPFKSDMQQTPVWRWCYGSEEEKKGWQTLINARAILFNISHKNELCSAVIFNHNLRNAYLKYLDFSGLDLKDIDLSKADLTGTNLSGANLSGANLSEANLTKANLIGANLLNVNLRNAIIDGIELFENFSLPIPCKDNQLIEIYQSDIDDAEKKLIARIITAKDLSLENK